MTAPSGFNTVAIDVIVFQTLTEGEKKRKQDAVRRVRGTHQGVKGGAFQVFNT